MAVGKGIVVVGGGLGGGLVANLLQNHANVVLIDPKEYMEIPFASLRSMIQPSVAKRSVINHSDHLTNARIVVSNAVDITQTEVVTSHGDRIAYDYLVVASGHVYSNFATKDEKLKYYQEEHEKIKSSDSILIVGGGPVGVELAGEIIYEYPNKKVTLVSRGPRLLEFIDPKASKKALDFLTLNGVKVILGQTINLNSSDGVYETSGGEIVRADRYYNCTGLPLSSPWLKSTFLKDSMDGKGKTLMVDSNLRVKGHKNIFGVGDITDIPELKQGYLAQIHAKVAAKNLKMLMGGVEEQKLAKYKPAPKAAFVSLGKKVAVAQVMFLTMFGRIPGMIKSDDLFVGKARKEYGLKP